jgi:hypothetical protein
MIIISIIRVIITIINAFAIVVATVIDIVIAIVIIDIAIVGIALASPLSLLIVIARVNFVACGAHDRKLITIFARALTRDGINRKSRAHRRRDTSTGDRQFRFLHQNA